MNQPADTLLAFYCWARTRFDRTERGAGIMEYMLLIVVGVVLIVAFLPQLKDLGSTIIDMAKNAVTNAS